MPGFVSLLQHNRNYRYAWTSQVVSEIGDHFNNIAVFSLALATTRSGLVVSGVMLARAVAAVVAAPVAGVILDRFDRRRVMIASDLVRAVIALGFIATIDEPRPWLLYTLSGLLMFASPFFSAGRSSILPAITTADELHTANSLTQTTQWTTLTVGTVTAGLGAAMLGYEAAFMLNALSFVVSAWAIWKVSVTADNRDGTKARRREGPTRDKAQGTKDEGRRTQDSAQGTKDKGRRTKDEGKHEGHEGHEGRHEGHEGRQDDEPQEGIHEGHEVVLAGGSRRPWHDYLEGLRYMRGQPLVLAIALLGVGWASGGGAAQILFSLFGELVFERGPAGIGIIWGAAGFGLIVGGMTAHRIGPRLSFTSYKRTIALCYLVHGGAYVMFSQAARFDVALFWIALSRAAVAVSSVLNWSLLLRLVAPEFRGRVFATNESLVWSTMMLSMLAAGIASQHVDPRAIGAVSGVLSSCTAIYWLWADRIGLLAEPRPPNPVRGTPVNPVDERA